MASETTTADRPQAVVDEVGESVERFDEESPAARFIREIINLPKPSPEMERVIFVFPLTAPKHEEKKKDDDPAKEPAKEPEPVFQIQKDHAKKKRAERAKATRKSSRKKAGGGEGIEPVETKMKPKTHRKVKVESAKSRITKRLKKK